MPPLNELNKDIIGEPPEINFGNTGPNQNIEPSLKGEVQYFWLGQIWPILTEVGSPIIYTD